MTAGERARDNNGQQHRRAKLRAGVSRDLVGYSFLLPWLVGFIGLTAWPILSSFYLSFTDFDLLSQANWVGWANYERMLLADPTFLTSMRVTFSYVLASVPLKLAFALAVALLLNRGLSGMSLYRSAFYLPSLLGASVAVAILWRHMFSSEGMLNALLGLMGIDGPSWISNPRYALWTLVILSVWQFGSPMLIFLAGLRQVPADIFEAATVDGVSRWRQFTRLTLPMITPVIFFNAVVQMIEAFKTFTPAFVVSGGSGGPINATLLYALYLYQEAFGFFRMGYASALAWVLLAIIAAFTAVSFFTSRYWVYYDE